MCCKRHEGWDLDSQTGEDVGQVFLGVDAVAPTALDDGVDDRAAPSRVGVPDEEPAFAIRENSP